MKGVIRIKELFCACILSCAISFMVFLYEPIILYANNLNDLWFDFYTIFPSLLQFFFISFLFISIINLSVFGLSKIIKKPSLFNIYYIALIIVFLIAYIHGNFFSGSLPTLTGDPIIWSDYTVEYIISIIICLVIIVTTIILAIKFKPVRIIKYTTYLTVAIFAMLVISSLNTIFTTDALKEKSIITYATNDNINTYSNDRNFLILLLDAVDSERFYKAVNEMPLYQDTFADFTYYPDTVGAYNLTRDSIPFIFSGKWDRNETDFITYSTDAFDNSPIFNKLQSDGYNMNLYDEDFTWQSRKALNFTNIDSQAKNINQTAFLKQEIKYVLFKYLPYPLKSFSKPDSIDFANTQSSDEKESFAWEDLTYYNNMLENPIELTNQKVFQYIHLEGAHVPYNLDEDFNPIDPESGTYEQKCIVTLKIINTYINRLKEANVYDNSSIIIMADHGVNHTANPNPILYIKGVNEHHAYQASDKAIWYPDLLEAYNELLNNKSSSEVFSNVSDEHRDRIIIQIPFGHEEHMIEWVQTGKAWDQKTLSKTGKEFDL